MPVVHAELGIEHIEDERDKKNALQTQCQLPLMDILIHLVVFHYVLRSGSSTVVSVSAAFDVAVDMHCEIVYCRWQTPSIAYHNTVGEDISRAQTGQKTALKTHILNTRNDFLDTLPLSRRLHNLTGFRRWIKRRATG